MLPADPQQNGARKSIRDLIGSMAHWLTTVNQRNLATAQEELTRMRELAQGLTDDPRLSNVGRTHHNHQPARLENSLECGIDFIAAVTDALRPGSYRSRPNRS